MRYAKSLRDIPGPGGPVDPDPGWNVNGLLGLAPEVVAADPVLRALHLTDFGNPADYHAVATLGGGAATRTQVSTPAGSGTTRTAAASARSSVAAVGRYQRDRGVRPGASMLRLL